VTFDAEYYPEGLAVRVEVGPDQIPEILSDLSIPGIAPGIEQDLLLPRPPLFEPSPSFYGARIATFRVPLPEGTAFFRQYDVSVAGVTSSFIVRRTQTRDGRLRYSVGVGYTRVFMPFNFPTIQSPPELPPPSEPSTAPSRFERLSEDEEKI
jgi:hypothetical protein